MKSYIKKLVFLFIVVISLFITTGVLSSNVYAVNCNDFNSSPAQCNNQDSCFFYAGGKGDNPARRCVPVEKKSTLSFTTCSVSASSDAVAYCYPNQRCESSDHLCYGQGTSWCGNDKSSNEKPNQNWCDAKNSYKCKGPIDDKGNYSCSKDDVTTTATACNGTSPKQACSTQTSAPSAACPSGGNDWFYLKDDKSNAWCTSKVGGGKDYCYQCAASSAPGTTGTVTSTPPTYTPTPTSIPPSSDFCAVHGGIKPGTPAEAMCGEKAFDGTEAAKAKGSGNPYCDKTYKVRYHCVDGDYWGPDEGTTKCNTTPWCTVPVTPTPGSGEACTASNAVNGKCPDAKPLCNTPTGEAPQCVAARSVAKDQHCSKNEVCSTNFCKDTGTTTPKVCADNLTPTATPTPMVSASDQCPIVDQSDGRPNTCYATSNATQAALDIPGYSLKSTDPNALPNAACSQHTNGLNPWCWHKNAPTGTLTPTPTATSQLATGCPNIDADNKANTCEDKPSSGTSCSTPGFKHKSPNNGGDAACTTFRNNAPSWCCHQN